LSSNTFLSSSRRTKVPCGLKSQRRRDHARDLTRFISHRMRALPVVPAGVDDVNIHSAVQSMQSLSLVLGDVDVSALSESVTSTVKDLIPADVDVNAITEKVGDLSNTVSDLSNTVTELIPQEAKDTVKGYVSQIDKEAIQSEVGNQLGVVKGLAGDAVGQVNEGVLQPYWKETAPKLEAYFREAWGDYYYDYFIDEWDSGVNDLNRLYNFLDTTVVAGDWKRLVALLGATYYSPSVLSFIFSLNKGYKGNLDALDALQLVEKTPGAIVDVRTDSEKNSGQPDMARSMRDSYLDVGYARDWLTPDVLKMASSKDMLCAKATSTVIADCRGVSKRQPLVLLDSGGDGRAKMVAKVLTSEHGFKKVFVINGGFSAWKQMRLPVKGVQGTQRRTIFF